MQNMVNAFVLLSTLESCYILWVFYYADRCVVTSWVGTDRTLWLVSKVLANTAKMNAFVGISDSRCKSRCVLVCHGHNIVGKALCGLHAYTRELCKLLCQKYQRQCV